MKLTVNAYAKINLSLYIVGKRPDGYHELETLMHSLPLCDRVSVETGNGGIRIFCDKDGVPCDEKNIAYRAASAYFDAAGITPDADIYIEKNIPVAGGFGGSSTDGAATLFLLEKIHAALGKERLFSLASELSADMPFCLAAIYKKEESYAPFCAQCGGIGERMSEKTSPIDGKFVLAASCGEGLSAKEMYARFDVARQNDCKTGKETDIYRIYNDFEEIAFALRPDIEKVKSFMLANGAGAALMSGSGSGVFGIFDTEEAAESCAKALYEKGTSSALCRIGEADE